ncbi:Protein of unknown function, partial [Gryllus bimaculatus]
MPLLPRHVWQAAGSKETSIPEALPWMMEGGGGAGGASAKACRSSEYGDGAGAGGGGMEGSGRDHRAAAAGETVANHTISGRVPRQVSALEAALEQAHERVHALEAQLSGARAELHAAERRACAATDEAVAEHERFRIVTDQLAVMDGYLKGTRSGSAIGGQRRWRRERAKSDDRTKRGNGKTARKRKRLK